MDKYSVVLFIVTAMSVNIVVLYTCVVYNYSSQALGGLTELLRTNTPMSGKLVLADRSVVINNAWLSIANSGQQLNAYLCFGPKCSVLPV